MADELERLQRRVEREKQARKIAEKLLEERSLDLFESNQQLKKAHDDLELRILERTAELKQSNEKLEKEVNERQKTMLELERARDKALEVSRLKSEFLANMSHEIRTPLNAVIGMNSLLLASDLSEEQRDFADTAKRSGEALLSLINDILDFSKIEADKLQLEYAPFNWHEAIDEVMELVFLQASSKGLELAFHAQHDLPKYIIGDVTRLKQVVLNLVNNAVKFTKDGEIVVSVTGKHINDKNYDIKFEVKDTGIGIAQKDQIELFDAFSQVDASTTREYGGTGLGLAISQRLVGLMGGKLGVTSELGQGSSFQFSFEVETDDLLSTLVDSQQEQSMVGKKVFIVDDNITNCRILSYQLKHWKISSEFVLSAKEALDVLKTGKQFDLAILDMQMPGMDGVELAQALKANPETKSLPLIMLTSLGCQNIQHPEYFESCLNKPAKLQKLKDSLASVFTQSQKQSKQTSPTVSNLAGSNPLRILLVEDQVVNQKVALKMLERLGYKADLANNGLEGVQACINQSYDLVFMDIQMPEMDGVEATLEIRQKLETQPHIVALTANALMGDKEKYLAQGMDGYLSKPISISDLNDAIQEAIEQLDSRKPEVSTMDTTTTTLNVSKLQELWGELFEELFVDMIEGYPENSQDYLSKLDKATTEQDAETVRLLAHSLKSNASNIGAEQLANFCQDLEDAARLENTAQFEQCFNLIQNEQENVIKAIGNLELSVSS